MIRYKNECIDCGLYCSSDCVYLRIPHYYCDNCGKECDDLFEYYSDELCEKCYEELAND